MRQSIRLSTCISCLWSAMHRDHPPAAASHLHSTATPSCHVLCAHPLVCCTAPRYATPRYGSMTLLWQSSPPSCPPVWLPAARYPPVFTSPRNDRWLLQDTLLWRSSRFYLNIFRTKQGQRIPFVDIQRHITDFFMLIFFNTYLFYPYMNFRWMLS